jgi:hypothetical protein
MAFTDDEILLLLDLDLDLELGLDTAEPPTRWDRLRSAAWWVAVAVGAVAAMWIVLHADYGYLPPRVTG